MTKLSQEDLLDILRSSVDDAYLEPLEEEDDGAGFDLHRAIAAQLARVSEAVEVSQQAMFISDHSEQTEASASGGTQATGNLNISRAAPTDGDIELYEGEIILVMLAGLDGQVITEAELEVASDTTFAAGVSGPLSVPVRAVRVGYHSNLLATVASGGRYVIFKQLTTKTLTSMTTTTTNRVTDSGSGDQFDDGVVGAWLRFTAGPNVGTGPRFIISFDAGTDTVVVEGPTLAASGSNDGEVVDLEQLGFTAEIDATGLSGGTGTELDGLGWERNIGRGTDETDAEYKERLRNLPDTIAPNALYRAASRILTPLGIPFRILESRNPNDFVGAAWGEFAWDDPETYNSILGRDQFIWQGDGFEKCGFYFVVERQGYGDFGAPYESWPTGSPAHPSDAWDEMFFDGFALGFYNDLQRAVDEVGKAKGSGVPWLLVLVDSIP